MHIKAGSKVDPIILPSIDGSTFNTTQLLGKSYMLSFYRFASCPFCNLRIHQLIKSFESFGKDFTMVAIFDSPLNNLQKHAAKHHAPFHILADEQNKYYKSFGIENSTAGMLKGMFFRLPTLIKGMMKGYVPLVIKGSMTTMPADFLIDREGTIQTAYYGKDEGDHLPIEVVRSFSKD